MGGESQKPVARESRHRVLCPERLHLLQTGGCSSCWAEPLPFLHCISKPGECWVVLSRLPSRWRLLRGAEKGCFSHCFRESVCHGGEEMWVSSHPSGRTTESSSRMRGPRRQVPSNLLFVTCFLLSSPQSVVPALLTACSKSGAVPYPGPFLLLLHRSLCIKM